MFNPIRVLRFGFWMSVFPLMLVLFVQTCDADVMYRLVDLGSVGDADSRAFDVNNTGNVVGWRYTDSEENGHAFVFSGNTVHDIHPPQCIKSAAVAINESGIVVGSSTNNSHETRATVWQNGYTTIIGPSESESLATAINNNGDVAGHMQINEQWRAFRYDTNSTDPNQPHDLGTLGGALSFAMGINSSRTVIGYSLTSSAEWQQRAFISNPDQPMTDLGTLGGYHSQANGINDAGTIVGWSWRNDSHAEAFIYHHGTMEGIGRLGGYSSSANDINKSGDVVGWWSPDGFNRHAFIRMSTGEMVDINSVIDPSVGWDIVDARAINDSGTIVGYGIDPNGVDRAVLLVPIPSTGIACFSGVVTLYRLCRSRTRKK